jgi:hypothetical protein
MFSICDQSEMIHRCENRNMPLTASNRCNNATTFALRNDDAGVVEVIAVFVVKSVLGASSAS